MTDATLTSSSALRSAVLAGLALLSPSCARADGPTAEADGIVAQMRVAADGVRVGWRFLRPPPARIASVSVRADGAPLPPPNGPVAAFPAPGQTAVVQCLFARGASASGLAAADLPAGVTVRTTRLAPPSTESPGSDLAEAIGRALDDLGAETADRRAILLSLDGPGLAGGPAIEAAARARQQDTPVFVALGREASAADRDAALRFADVARGAVLDGGRDLATQLDDTALSGAELSFPFSVAPRLPWQGRTADLQAEIDYGGHSLALHAAVDRPAADGGEVAAALWDATRPQLPGFCAGAAIAAAVGSAMRARASLAGGRRS